MCSSDLETETETETEMVLGAWQLVNREVLVEKAVERVRSERGL